MLTCFTIALFAAADKKLLPGFECSGTEPFWGLTIQGNKSIKFSSPEIKEELFVPVSYITPLGQEGVTYIYNTTSKRSKGAAVITILKSACEDGMSNTEYDYTVIIDKIKDKVAFSGCCSMIK